MQPYHSGYIFAPEFFRDDLGEIVGAQVSPKECPLRWGNCTECGEWHLTMNAGDLIVCEGV